MFKKWLYSTPEVEKNADIRMGDSTIFCQESAFYDNVNMDSLDIGKNLVNTENKEVHSSPEKQMRKKPINNSFYARVINGFLEYVQPPKQERLRAQERLSAVHGFSFSGIQGGTKKQLMSFVHNLDKARVDSGIFLQEFVPVYDIQRGKDFTYGNDYNEVSQFPGRDVYLCSTTRRPITYCVTKLVPLEDKEGLTRLRHSQQVHLVVGLQEEFEGVAKIHGVIKRVYRGRKYGEIFMEYCGGGTLRDNIDNLHSLNLIAKWRLTENILKIVEHIHQQTIVHGDLKPANICFRGHEVVLIDFESGKHPDFPNNNRATCLFLPPWMRSLIASRDFELLKTIDMWSVGMVLLDIVFGKLLWKDEYDQLLICDTCDTTDGRCQHVQTKMLLMMEKKYPDSINAYLPDILPDDHPLLIHMGLLIHGLLPVGGVRAQLTASEAKEALEDSNILVQIRKRGKATIAPLIVKRGITVKEFLRSRELIKLKDIHEDLREGMWLTFEQRASGGSVKQYAVWKNQILSQSCVLHVYPPIGT